MATMKTILRICVISVICGSLLSGCASTGEQSVAGNAATFANSKAGIALETALINATLDAAAQYVSSGDIDPRHIVAATLDGGAENLRSVAGSANASSPKAISDAVALGANVPGVSKVVPPIVAGSVVRQIQAGTHPDQAIENLATVMNKGASDARKVKPLKR